MEARRKRTSKLLALLITFSLLLGLVPGNVFASDKVYALWVGGVQVTGTNADDVLNDGTVSYDADSNTLTLNSAYITNTFTPYNISYGIYTNTETDLTLNLIGNSIVTSTADNGADDAYGICSLDNVTVSGTGILTATGKTCGFIVDGKLVVDSGTLNGNSKYRFAITGINAGDMTVNGGKVIGVASNGDYGITVNNSFTVTGGEIFAIGEEAGIAALNYYDSEAEAQGAKLIALPENWLPEEYKIYATTGKKGEKYYAVATIARMDLEPSFDVDYLSFTNVATGITLAEPMSDTNYGLWVGGKRVTSINAGDVLGDGKVSYDADSSTLTLNNADITGKRYLTVYDDFYESYSGYECGIYTDIDLTLKLEGTNSVSISSADTDYAHGIYAPENVTVTVGGSGNLTSKGVHYGVKVGMLNVESGNITGAATDSWGIGVRVEKDVTVKGGSITGKSVGTRVNGFQVEETLTVQGGQVIGTTDGYYGISVGKLDMSGGEITAKGTEAAIAVTQSFDTLIKAEAYAEDMLMLPEGCLSEKQEIFTTTGEYLYNRGYYAAATIVLKGQQISYNNSTFTGAVKEITLTEPEMNPQPQEYNVSVCGIFVTSDNKDDVMGSRDGDKATVRYNPYTNTITLDNATLTTYADGVYSFANGKDFAVELIGENTIGPEQGTPYAGIVSFGNLKIKGKGSLIVNDLPYGITTVYSSWFGGGSTTYDIIIEDGVTLTFNSTEKAMTAKPTLSENFIIKAGDSVANATEVTDTANTDYHINKYVSIDTRKETESDNLNDSTNSTDQGKPTPSNPNEQTPSDSNEQTPSSSGEQTLPNHGKPMTYNPSNGIVKVNDKMVLYKDGKAVKGTTVVTVAGKTYAVVGGYVKTGTKNRLVKIGKNSYVVNKWGIIIKSTKNKLVKVGKKCYIVSKKGIVIKGAKNKLVKVGKKCYIVSKKGIVYKNKKSVKVGRKNYKVNKKGIATKM